MSEARDLQRMIERAQDRYDNKRPKTLQNIKTDFLERFAPPRYQEEARKMSLDDIKGQLGPVMEALRELKNDEWQRDNDSDSDPNLTMYKEIDDVGEPGWLYVKNRKFTRHDDWGRYLRRRFIDLLYDLEICVEDLLECPQCGNIYTTVGKTKKNYCTNRCAIEATRNPK